MEQTIEFIVIPVGAIIGTCILYGICKKSIIAWRNKDTISPEAIAAAQSVIQIKHMNQGVINPSQIAYTSPTVAGTTPYPLIYPFYSGQQPQASSSIGYIGHPPPSAPYAPYAPPSGEPTEPFPYVTTVRV